MGNLQIKNVPDDLHAELRRRAAQSDGTVRDYLLALIRADQELPTVRDWLQTVAERPRVDLPPDAGLDALHAARDERDADRTAAR